MKQKLIYFLAKYGNDFFHKLPKYQTAQSGGKHGVYVKLVKYNPENLTFTVEDEHGTVYKEIDLFNLDEFCL